MGLWLPSTSPDHGCGVPCHYLIYGVCDNCRAGLELPRPRPKVYTCA